MGHSGVSASSTTHCKKQLLGPRLRLALSYDCKCKSAEDSLKTSPGSTAIGVGHYPPPAWVYELLRFGLWAMFIAVGINSFLWSRLQIQSDVGDLVAYIELVVISDILVL